MTPVQLSALDFIREQIVSFGVAPTLDEIGAQVGMSKPGAHRIVGKLVDGGHLRRTAAHHRGLALADQVDLRGVGSDMLRAELARRGVTMDMLARPQAVNMGRRAVTCAADCCQVEVQRGMLMCRAHWFALPGALREGIMRAFGAKDADRYQSLVAEARDRIDGGRS